MWFFFYNLLKFDTVNADVPFYKKGHKFETEEKLNKARHTFSNKVEDFISRIGIMLLNFRPLHSPDIY